MKSIDGDEPPPSANGHIKGSRPRYQYAGVDNSHPHFRPRWMRPRRSMKLIALSCLACLSFIAFAQWKQLSGKVSLPKERSSFLNAEQLRKDLELCSQLRKKPQDPIGPGRQRNARHVDGHRPTLIRNATIWVGEPSFDLATPGSGADTGGAYTWTPGDVYLEYGLIQKVAESIPVESLPGDARIWNAEGRRLTSGIIDMHSHAGVSSLPDLVGSEDTNELSGDITPYVRSIDAFNPLDPQIQVIKSGGVTTSLVLPGSGNNIGGEAYVFKHAVGKEDGRPEISAEDMLADPDRNWRYMKMACGENAKRVYGRIGRGPFSRMGESWEFRHAFEQSAALVRKQDDWCKKAETLGIGSVDEYLPQDLKWESLAAVLRGQVHVNTHCYTIPDLEAFVNHTNEFQFPLRAFHHAHQTFLVPEILKRAWGDRPPASALFADNMYYKFEAYVGSEYAGKILWDNGLMPVYVSDNPVLNAQHVVFEAAKAYRYGLPYHVAMSSVTSAPAEQLGLGQRLGKIKPGFDADVVVWDSDPLSVGSAPVQVWIDGYPQFDDPFRLHKPSTEPAAQPKVMPGNLPSPPASLENAIFTGIHAVLLDDLPESLPADSGGNISAVITRGQITCIGLCEDEIRSGTTSSHRIIALENGYLTKPFTATGSLLGLNAIDAEADTDNGPNPTAFSRGIHGLALDTKKLQVAYRYGVTKAISAPKCTGGFTHCGTSVGFATNAHHSAEDNAVWAEDVAFHFTLTPGAKYGETPSISSAVGKIRRDLLAAIDRNDSAITDDCSEESFLKKVVNGTMPLVITAHSADTIATVLRLKESVDKALASRSSSSPSGSVHTRIRLIILGGAESHLVAEELAAADAGVILAPFQSYGVTWDQRRALTGAPLTNGTAVDTLIAAGVVTAIGLEEDWLIRDLGLLAGIAYHNGGGALSEKEALDLVSSNVFKMLGIKDPDVGRGRFLVHEGSPLDIASRVRAVSPGSGHITIFD